VLPRALSRRTRRPIATIAGANDNENETPLNDATGIIAQKQDGLFAVEIGRATGAIQAHQLQQLAGVVERFGERVLRATNWQRAVLRDVPAEQLPTLQSELAGIGFGMQEPRVLRRMVVCAGASTCRLGICLSRGAGAAIHDTLRHGDLSGKAGLVTLSLSGCPNACAGIRSRTSDCSARHAA